MFRSQKFTETQKVSCKNCFGSVRQKTSTENRDITFLCTKCFEARNLLKHRRFLARIVSVVWDKKPRQKIVISPSYAKKSSIPEIFWNTEGFFYEMFQCCVTKNVVRKSWYPLLMHKMFRYQTFSETRKSSPRTFFRTVRQKTSTENRDITFLSTNFWMPEILFKHRGVPLRSFSVLWDRKFSTENQDIRIYAEIFSIPQVF